MKDQGKDAVRQWVRRWSQASRALEEERIRQIRNSDTAAFVRLTAGIVEALSPGLPSRESSGLVRQQERFRGQTA